MLFSCESLTGALFLVLRLQGEDGVWLLSGISEKRLIALEKKSLKSVRSILILKVASCTFFVIMEEEVSWISSNLDNYQRIFYRIQGKFPDKPALLIKLKDERNTESALAQIRRQEYPNRLLHCKGNILLVSININRNV